MHDWTLLDVSLDWKQSRADMRLGGPGRLSRSLVCDGVTHLEMTHLEAWGPSQSINSYSENLDASTGMTTVAIEMQSGDLIRVVAKVIRKVDAPWGLSLQSQR